MFYQRWYNVISDEYVGIKDVDWSHVGTSQIHSFGTIQRHRQRYINTKQAPSYLPDIVRVEAIVHHAKPTCWRNQKNRR